MAAPVGRPLAEPPLPPPAVAPPAAVRPAPGGVGAAPTQVAAATVVWQQTWAGMGILWVWGKLSWLISQIMACCFCRKSGSVAPQQEPQAARQAEVPAPVVPQRPFEERLQAAQGDALFDLFFEMFPQLTQRNAVYLQIGSSAPLSLWQQALHRVYSPQRVQEERILMGREMVKKVPELLRAFIHRP